MIDFLAKLFDLLVGTYQRRHDKQARDRRHKAGQALITAYFHLLQVIDTGREIVAVLKRLSVLVASNRIDRADRDLVKQLYCQAENLEHLGHALQDVAAEFMFFAPDAALELGAPAHGKMSLFSTLVAALRDGDYPTLATFILRSTLPDEEEQRHWESTMFGAGMNAEKSINLLRLSDMANRRQRIKRWLKSDEVAQLDRLEHSAESLRQLILQHFTLDEVLWSINAVRGKARRMSMMQSGLI